MIPVVECVKCGESGQRMMESTSICLPCNYGDEDYRVFEFDLAPARKLRRIAALEDSVGFLLAWIDDTDLAKNDDDRQLLGLVTRVLARAVAGPPGVPKARIDAVRAAFDKTMKDPAYLADMKKRKMAISNPMTGSEVAKYIDGIAATPKRIVDRYIAAVRN